MFLGIKITKNEDSFFELSHSFLIERLLSVLFLRNYWFETNPNTSSTSVDKSLLHRDLAGKPHNLSWKYCTAVGMISYLQDHT